MSATLQTDRQAIDEPAPKAGEVNVAPVGLLTWSAAARHQILKGKEKYDTSLQSFNGRNAFNDFCQEIVDTHFYATQLYLEATTFAQLTGVSIGLIAALRNYIDGDDHDIGEVLDACNAYVERAGSCIERSGLVASPEGQPVPSVDDDSENSSPGDLSPA